MHEVGFTLAKYQDLILPIRKTTKQLCHTLYSQFQMDDEAINMPSPLELVHEKWLNGGHVARELSELQREFSLPIPQLRDFF